MTQPPAAVPAVAMGPAAALSECPPGVTPMRAPVLAPACASAESDLSAIPPDEVRVYLNNAATTWPKPEPVITAVRDCLRGCGSAMRQAGGSGAGVMDLCRNAVAAFLNVPSPERLTFLPGCTYALNLALHGLDWHAGDVVAMSGLEHHAVSRPIRKVAERCGVRFEVSPYAPGRPFDLAWLEALLKRERVRLVAHSMASNVTGEILPTRDIVRLARAHGALTLVDSAQAAGLIPVDVAGIGCDMFAFAGHKGLLGPLGIGGLWAREGLQLDTIAEGGTGGDSGKHDMVARFPAGYEVGSHNLPAIAGLGAGVAWLAPIGPAAVHAYEGRLADRLRDALADLPGLRIIGGRPPEGCTAVVSFTVAGRAPRDIADQLAARFGVAARGGFHCAPLAHETLGTLPLGGTVRLSPGFFNIEADIDHAAQAVADIIAAR